MTSPSSFPVALTIPASHTAKSSWKSHPLATIVGWEMRRFTANRSVWILLALAFLVTFAIEWVVAKAELYTVPSANGTRTFLFAWTGNYGLLNTLPQDPGMFLGMFLPFLNADSVALDLERRSHELIMATPIPSWAYVWGRYCSGLLLSLGVACLALAAILLTIAIRHQAQPGVFPSPDLRTTVALWALFILPPTFLLSGVSFALGTLLPRHTTLIKVTMSVGWLICSQVIRWTAVYFAGVGKSSQYYAWDPTGLALANAQTSSSIIHQLALQTRTLSAQAFLAQVHATEQYLPDMRPWILPHLTLALIGIALVALASFAFRRFRNL